MGGLPEKLNRTTAYYRPLPFFLVHVESEPDYGEAPTHLKDATAAWWDSYESDKEYCDCPDTECLRPVSQLCRITHEVEREYRIEFLAYDLFDAMIAPGRGYQLKYLPVDDPSADWRPISESRLRTLHRCEKNLAESTITFDGTEVKVRVFRISTASGSENPERRGFSRGGRPPKYDWVGFHKEITRIALIEGELPDRRELHRRMAEWCADNWPEQPEDSEIRKRMDRLYRTPGILP